MCRSLLSLSRHSLLLGLFFAVTLPALGADEAKLPTPHERVMLAFERAIEQKNFNLAASIYVKEFHDKHHFSDRDWLPAYDPSSKLLAAMIKDARTNVTVDKGNGKPTTMTADQFVEKYTLRPTDLAATLLSATADFKNEPVFYALAKKFNGLDDTLANSIASGMTSKIEDWAFSAAGKGQYPFLTAILKHHMKDRNHYKQVRVLRPQWQVPWEQSLADVVFGNGKVQPNDSELAALLESGLSPQGFSDQYVSRPSQIKMLSERGFPFFSHSRSFLDNLSWVGEAGQMEALDAILQAKPRQLVPDGFTSLIYDKDDKNAAPLLEHFLNHYPPKNRAEVETLAKVFGLSAPVADWKDIVKAMITKMFIQSARYKPNYPTHLRLAMLLKLGEVKYTTEELKAHTELLFPENGELISDVDVPTRAAALEVLLGGDRAIPITSDDRREFLLRLVGTLEKQSARDKSGKLKALIRQLRKATLVYDLRDHNYSDAQIEEMLDLMVKSSVRGRSVPHHKPGAYRPHS